MNLDCCPTCSTCTARSTSSSHRYLILIFLRRWQKVLRFRKLLRVSGLEVYCSEMVKDRFFTNLRPFHDMGTICASSRPFHRTDPYRLDRCYCRLLRVCYIQTISLNAAVVLTSTSFFIVSLKSCATVPSFPHYSCSWLRSRIATNVSPTTTEMKR